MNETTLLLAKIIGPTMLAFGLGIVLNAKYYEKAFEKSEKNRFGVMMIAMIMMVAGTVVVMKHFLWTSLTEVIVSLVGLGMLVKGAFLAVFPKLYQSIVDSLLSRKLIYFGGAIWILAGAYLLRVGFLS